MRSGQRWHLAQQVLVSRPQLPRRPHVGTLGDGARFLSPHPHRPRRDRVELGAAGPVEKHRGHHGAGQVGPGRDDPVLRQQDGDRVTERGGKRPYAVPALCGKINSAAAIGATAEPARGLRASKA